MKEISCMETTFSKIFDKNSSLEMGLYFSKTQGSSVGFFKGKQTVICLKEDGEIPVAREQFIIK